MPDGVDHQLSGGAQRIDVNHQLFTMAVDVECSDDDFIAVAERFVGCVVSDVCSLKLDGEQEKCDENGFHFFSIAGLFIG